MKTGKNREKLELYRTGESVKWCVCYGKVGALPQKAKQGL